VKSVEHCVCVPHLGWQAHVEIYSFSVVCDFMLNSCLAIVKFPGFFVCELWTVIAELRRIWRMKTSFRHMHTTMGTHIMSILIELLLDLPGSQRTALGHHIWMVGMMITAFLLQKRVRGLKALRATSLVSKQKVPCQPLRHQCIPTW